MNNFDRCNDTFCSEKGSKKADFDLKTAKSIQKRCFEGNKVRNRKRKHTKCRLLAVAQDLRRIHWEQLGSVQ